MTDATQHRSSRFAEMLEKLRGKKAQPDFNPRSEPVPKRVGHDPKGLCRRPPPSSPAKRR